MKEAKDKQHARPVVRSKSPGQEKLEDILVNAPRWNPMGTPVGLDTAHGTLAADADGVHFKPLGARTLYSVSWEQVQRMFKLETLAANPDAAVFKGPAIGKGK